MEFWKLGPMGSSVARLWRLGPLGVATLGKRSYNRIYRYLRDCAGYMDQRAFDYLGTYIRDYDEPRGFLSCPDDDKTNGRILIWLESG